MGTAKNMDHETGCALPTSVAAGTASPFACTQPVHRWREPHRLFLTLNLLYPRGCISACSLELGQAAAVLQREHPLITASSHLLHGRPPSPYHKLRRHLSSRRGAA
jgi:hypothetical protein